MWNYHNSNIHDIMNTYEKTYRIINSCVTVGQYNSALRYVKLYIKFLNTNKLNITDILYDRIVNSIQHKLYIKKQTLIKKLR